MRVLRAHGVQAESRLPFAGLHACCARLDVLPVPAAQAGALSAALGLDEPRGQSRFLVAAGVLGLLAELADREPVVCLVDDAQWVDGSSLDALFFAARRIESDRLAILVATRPGEIEAPGLTELRLDPIAPEHADRLLADHVPALLPRPSRSRIIELAAGNPLALVELGDELAPTAYASLAGRPELPLSTRLEATSSPGSASSRGDPAAAARRRGRRLGDLKTLQAAAGAVGSARQPSRRPSGPGCCGWPAGGPSSCTRSWPPRSTRPPGPPNAAGARGARRRAAPRAGRPPRLAPGGRRGHPDSRSPTS